MLAGQGAARRAEKAESVLEEKIEKDVTESEGAIGEGMSVVITHVLQCKVLQSEFRVLDLEQTVTDKLSHGNEAKDKHNEIARELLHLKEVRKWVCFILRHKHS